MELKECITCGSHNFTDNKCDYCGNVYALEVTQKQQATFEEDDYLEYKAQELTEQNKKVLKIMVWILISIIWFAVCVFIPPLFIITICSLIIWICRKFYKKINNNI